MAKQANHCGWSITRETTECLHNFTIRKYECKTSHKKKRVSQHLKFLESVEMHCCSEKSQVIYRKESNWGNWFRHDLKCERLSLEERHWFMDLQYKKKTHLLVCHHQQMCRETNEECYSTIIHVSFAFVVCSHPPTLKDTMFLWKKS
jgi:hypothetical protein